jgi:hypothetical protein
VSYMVGVDKIHVGFKGLTQLHITPSSNNLNCLMAQTSYCPLVFLLLRCIMQKGSI